MIELEYAKDPVETANGIDLTCKFKHLQEEVRFSASKDDVVEHGRDIYLRAYRGEFGAVQLFVAPSAAEVAKRPNAKRRKLDLNLAKEKIYHYELMLDNEKAEEWKQFYRDTYNLINQPEWPLIEWPTQPEEE